MNPETIGGDQQVGIATLSGGNITGTTDDCRNALPEQSDFAYIFS
ncbi:MAG: hypothetical protein ACRD40_15705 [Candidatus Acidiferrales bacterium]